MARRSCSRKPDGHAVVGGEEDDFSAVGDFGGDEFVVFIDADGDDAAGHDVGEIFEWRPF